MTNTSQTDNTDDLTTTGCPPIHWYTIKVGQFFASIISFASVHPIDVPALSAVRCYRRPGRKACQGRIWATQKADIVDWHCSDCDFFGEIHGWKGSDNDLSHTVSEEQEDVLYILLTDDEYKALVTIETRIDDVDAVIGGAETTPEGIKLSGTEYDFKDLLDDLRMDVNCRGRSKRVKVLSGIAEIVERLLG